MHVFMCMSVWLCMDTCMYVYIQYVCIYTVCMHIAMYNIQYICTYVCMVHIHAAMHAHKFS